MGPVAVALSGGVDSAIAALCLKQAGHQIIGLSLRLGLGPDEGPAAGRQVAEQLGLEHRVVDAAETFEREVVHRSTGIYCAGKTPNPCALCNATVKLPLLWESAQDLGCDFLATGHYCGTRQTDQGWRLVEAADRHKSQAYFLARVGQDLLGHLRFPLAGLSKDRVRAMAADAGLEAAQRAESQDACFVGPQGWDQLVRERHQPIPGVMEDAAGRVLGRHQGVHCFTIGQRRGLGLALGRAVYVTAINGARAAVKVGPEDDLMATGLWGNRVRWFGEGPDDQPYWVRVRYNHPGVSCRVKRHGDAVEIHFAQPQRAVAPGQLAVVSRDEEICGSAWIEKAIA